MTEAQNTSSVKKYYLGTFEATKMDGSDKPDLDVWAIDKLIQKELKTLSEVCQFRGVVTSEDSLDAIVEAGTDVPGRDYTWASSPPPSGHPVDAVIHAYYRVMLSKRGELPVRPVIGVIAYRASELVSVSDRYWPFRGGRIDDYNRYEFKTSPKEAFVALLYFHVKLLELHLEMTI